MTRLFPCMSCTLGNKRGYEDQRDRERGGGSELGTRGAEEAPRYLAAAAGSAAQSPEVRVPVSCQSSPPAEKLEEVSATPGWRSQIPWRDSSARSAHPSVSGSGWGLLSGTIHMGHWSVTGAQGLGRAEIQCPRRNQVGVSCMR